MKRLTAIAAGALALVAVPGLRRRIGRWLVNATGTNIGSVERPRPE